MEKICGSGDRAATIIKWIDTTWGLCPIVAIVSGQVVSGRNRILQKLGNSSSNVSLEIFCSFCSRSGSFVVVGCSSLNIQIGIDKDYRFGRQRTNQDLNILQWAFKNQQVTDADGSPRDHKCCALKLRKTGAEEITAESRSRCIVGCPSTTSTLFDNCPARA